MSPFRPQFRLWCLSWQQKLASDIEILETELRLLGFCGQRLYPPLLISLARPGMATFSDRSSNVKWKRVMYLVNICVHETLQYRSFVRLWLFVGPYLILEELS